MSTGKLTACTQRWVNELADYRFLIRYKPGKRNQVADCLSRAPIDTKVTDPNEIYSNEITIAETDAIKEGIILPECDNDLWVNFISFSTPESNDHSDIPTIDLKLLQRQDPAISKVINAFESNH